MRRSIIVTSAALMLGTGLVACSSDSGERDSDGRADRNSRSQSYDSARQSNDQWRDQNRDRSMDNDRVRVNPEPSRDTPYQRQNDAYDPHDTTRFHPETDYGHRQ